MFTTVFKSLTARMDQIEHILKNYLAGHQASLTTLESALKAKFEADLAAQKAVLTQQFNAALASLEQTVQNLQKQVSSRGGSSIRTEEQEMEDYRRAVAIYQKERSDRIPS